MFKKTLAWLLALMMLVCAMPLSVFATETTGVAQLNNGTPTTLQAAINAAATGDNTITLLGDCSESVTIKQTAGKNIVIDGANNVYTGTITIDGNSNYQSEEFLKFENIVFKAAISIMADGTSPHNVTFSKCEFITLSDYIINIRENYNWKILDCTVTGVGGAFMQAAAASNNLHVENFKSVDSAIVFKLDYCSGFGDTATFKNIKIENALVGLYISNRNAGAINLEACNIEAQYPIRVWFRSDGNPSKVTILTKGGENVVCPTGADAWLTYQGSPKTDVVFPNGEPTVGGSVAQIGETKYKTLQEAIDACKSGETIQLIDDIAIDGYDSIHVPKLTSNRNGQYDEAYGEGAIFYIYKSNVILDLNGHSITWDAHDEYYCDGVTTALFRVTVEGAKNKDGSVDPRSFTVKDSVGTGKVTIYGNPAAVYSTFMYATANIEGGTWTNYPCQDCKATGYFIYPSHGSTMNITGGTFQQVTAEGITNKLLGWQGSSVAGQQNYLCDYSKTNLNISGGTFVGFNPSEQVKFIDRGTGKYDDINGCANGYIAEDCGNNVYKVIEGYKFGTWGGIDWKLYNDGTLIIAPTKGTPELNPNINDGVTRYEVGAWREAVVYKKGSADAIGGWPYKSSETKIKKLVIEEGVTSIGSFAFNGAYELDLSEVEGEVVIPSTVTYIGQEAFQKSNITKLTFAEGGTAPLCIANGAFKQILIEDIKLPGDREYIHIHHWAFGGCSNLKTAYIPANITKIWGGEHVDYFDNFNSQTNVSWKNDSLLFTGCANLQSITFGSEAARDMFFANNRNGINSYKNGKYNGDYIEAYVGLTAYNTLQNAVDAAEAGGTVTLVKSKQAEVDTLVTATVGKALTILKNGKTATITAADGYEVKETDTAYVVEKEDPVVIVNDVPYASWEEAMAANDFNSTNNKFDVKNATIVLLADISYDKEFEHAFSGNTVINLNGHSFYAKRGIAMSDTVKIVGPGTFDAGNDSWPLSINGNVYLDPTAKFTGTLQFSSGKKGNLWIGKENALGSTGKYNTADSDAFVRIIFRQGLEVLDFQYGRVTLTKDDATLDNQKITIGANAIFTVAKDVVLGLNPSTALTLNGKVDGDGTVMVSSFEHLKQVINETEIKNIKLGADVSGIMTIGHNAADQVTIDLNGHTWSSPDVALNVFRAGTEVTLKNGTIKGNSTGGTVHVTYGGKLILGENLTVLSGSRANAISMDTGILEVAADANPQVIGGIGSVASAGNTTNTINIASGFYDGDFVMNDNTTCALTGGTYTLDVDQYCADGYMTKITTKDSNCYWTVVKAVPLFAIHGSNMNLGNSLDMNFFIDPVAVDNTLADEKEDKNHTAIVNAMNQKVKNWSVVITRIEKGGIAHTKTYTSDAWWYNKGAALMYVIYEDIAARNMTDTIYVQVFDANGTPVTAIWEDSVYNYANRIMKNTFDDAENGDAKAKKRMTLMVDMLNYGAAAQKQFGYRLDALASDIDASYTSYATSNYESLGGEQSIQPENSTLYSDLYVGVSLGLTSDLKMGFAFDESIMDLVNNHNHSITVTHTDYHGKEHKTEYKSGYEFGTIESNDNIALVYYEEILVGDCNQIVTVTVTNDKGEAVLTIKDSVYYYVDRMGERVLPCGIPLLKFSQSARAYLGKAN